MQYSTRRTAVDYIIFLWNSLLLAVTTLPGQVNLTALKIVQRNYDQMSATDENADFIMLLIRSERSIR
jgi:hypothetical protein